MTARPDLETVKLMLLNGLKASAGEPGNAYVDLYDGALTVDGWFNANMLANTVIEWAAAHYDRPMGARTLDMIRSTPR